MSGDPGETVREINACWTSGRFADLEALLDENVVMTGPGLSGRIVGRAPAIDSYRDFTTQARVRSFSEGDYVVDRYGDVAIVTYPFDISYVMDGIETRDVGQELFILTLRDGRWIAVWRTLAVTPSVPPAASAEVPAR